MKFDVTLEELWQPAEFVAAYLQADGHVVTAESTPWEDAPFVTTLLARKRANTAPSVLVEIQGELDYTDRLRDLNSYLKNGSLHAELYIALGENAVIHAGTLNRLANDGVGLMVVDGAGHVAIRQPARNPALTVHPDPGLVFGDRAQDVREIFRKFNRENRQDAFRDTCELVEGLTSSVGIAAIRRGIWTITEQQFNDKDWNSQINALASVNICVPGRVAICDHRLQTDLHAFRNARNLVDHPARTLRERYRRERQFVDKLLLGSRLVAELVALRARVRRGR